METDWHHIDEIRERFLELDLTLRVTHAPSETAAIEPRLPRLLILLRAFPMGSVLTVVHRNLAEHKELDQEQTEEIREALRGAGFPEKPPQILSPREKSGVRDFVDITGTIAGTPFTVLFSVRGHPYEGPGAERLRAFLKTLLSFVEIEPAVRTLLAEG